MIGKLSLICSNTYWLTLQPPVWLSAAHSALLSLLSVTPQKIVTLQHQLWIWPFPPTYTLNYQTGMDCKI